MNTNQSSENIEQCVDEAAFDTPEVKPEEHHAENFSDEKFWDKTTRYAKKAGEKALSPALKMYYAAQDADTPLWAKTTMYSALGYFILPVDAIPDITPLAGYSDDIGVMAGAIGVVAAHIKDEHAERAIATLKSWFK